MKKVLVFGATGNLGAYTIDYLYEYLDTTEYEIIAVGRKKTDFFERYNVKYVQLDVTNTADFLKLPTENVYAVVDFVGILPAHLSGFNPGIYADVNVRGTINILEYCRQNKVDRIIYTQTEADLAGHWDKTFVIKPDMPRSIILSGNYAIYCITKSAAVDLIETYWNNFNLKRFIFRLPNIYHYKPSPYFYKNGKKQYSNYRYLIEQAIAGNPIEVWGDPTRAKDIVYVKDFAQMVYKAIIADCNGGLYNAGTGIATTLDDQIKGIVEVFSPANNKSQLIYCPDKPDSRSYLMDIENAKRDLGYEPRYSYIDYLRDFKIEMQKNRFADLWDE